MKRRGLSTVIGATFFVIVMGSTIGYVTYSIDLIDDLAREVDEEQDRKLNRLTEEFTISEFGTVNNEFNLTVTNTGSLPINITKMWAQNTTDSNWNQTSYTINQVVSPGATVVDIGIGTGLITTDSQSYSLKLLTSRGNSEQIQTVSVGGGGSGSGALEMSLFAAPKTLMSDQNVTMIYTVRNNLTAGVISSIVPSFESPVDATGSAAATLQGSIDPPSFQNLQVGEIAIFEAQYLVTGGNLETLTFNATIANAVQGNFVQEPVMIDIAPVSESAINEVLGGQIGVISMNFTSFEACRPINPAQQNCETDEPNWHDAWDLINNSNYLLRINVTNNGVNPIVIEQATNILAVYTKSGGGGSFDPYFIRNPSTDTDENPGAYTDLSITLPANPNISTALYFGSEKISDDKIRKLDSTPGIVAAFVVLYGYEDHSPTGGGIGPEDTTYGQTLPFQAYRIV